jgi:hypothetical protein
MKASDLDVGRVGDEPPVVLTHGSATASNSPTVG